MKQPYRIIDQHFSQLLEGYKREYDIDLGYRKITPSGFNDVSIVSNILSAGVVKPYGYYEIEIYLSLRNEPVTELLDALSRREAERPIDRTGPSYNNNISDIRPTVLRPVVDWYPFDPQRDQLYELRFEHLEQDTEAAFERFKAMMREDGFPWFERYADPLNIARDINDPIGKEPGDKSGHHLSGQHDRRAEIGIAAACVAQPERVPELYEAWLEFERRFDAFAMTRGRPRPFEPDMRRRFDIIIEEARKRDYLAD